MPKRNGNGAPTDLATGKPMAPANYGPKPQMEKVKISDVIGGADVISHPIQSYQKYKELRDWNKRKDWEASHNLYPGRQPNPRGNAKTNNDTRGSR